MNSNLPLNREVTPLEILDKVEEMLNKYPLCDHCLGRQFALLGYGIDNKKRGEALKTVMVMKGHRLALLGKKEGIDLLKKLASNGFNQTAATILKGLKKRYKKAGLCYLCEGKFDLLDDITAKVIEKLQDYEYSTFLVGVELPNEVEEREDEFKAKFGIEHGENIRNEFSREVGKRIQKIVDKKVDYKRPEVVALIDPFRGEVKLQVNPVFIAGRYRKLVRNIPQTRWICPECGGRGCPKCEGTGKTGGESIEDLVGKPILEEIGGREAVLHAAGREDVDARMLGQGRPFVMEIKEPKKRSTDLRRLTRKINEYAEGKVEVLKLHFVDRDTVRELKKKESAEKLYRAIVEFDRAVPEETLNAITENLTDTIIYQRTPTRVSRRRADRVREKYIYEVKIKRLKPNSAEMRIRCQGGLYVKELVSGDNGRTKPSVASIAGVKAEVKELDVLEVIEGRN